LYRIAALSLSVVFALVAAEGAVRIRQWWRYGASQVRLYDTTIDPASGLTIPTPNQERGRIKINSLGFRGPEVKLPKPAGTIRLAFMGASTTFCAEVTSNQQVWAQLVTDAFRRRWPDVDFDYVNAAFPGYVVDTNRRNLAYRVRPLQPDIIVLYEGVNDLSVDLRRLAESQGLSRGEADEEDFIGRWSLAWRLVEKNLRLLAREHRATQTNAQHARVDPPVLSRRFAGTFEELVEEAQKVAPVVAVVTFSQKVRADQSPEVQLSNANTHLYYMPYLSPADFIGVFAEYNRVMRDTAVSHRAVLVGGEDEIPADDRHFADSVHFTDEGSRAQGLRVSSALMKTPEVEALVHKKAAVHATAARYR
jgi:lysophospholipase L1-like esterase